jgi:hypothetical protein
MPANHRHERHHRHGCEEVAYLCGSLDDDEHDDGMTVPKHLAIHRHVENPIGIGKSTAHDTNDGDDDGLQRFSNWGGVSPEMGDVRWARNIGSTRLSTCDAGPRPEPPASPRLFRRFSSHPPSVHLRHKAGRRSACNTLDPFLRLLRFMRPPRDAWLPT